MKSFILLRINIRSSMAYEGVLIGIGVLCMRLLWMITNDKSFDTYSKALPIAFALSCAAMLLGLLLSIGLICEDYMMIRRELRNGISPFSIVMAKTAEMLLVCLIISFILILPYLWNHFDVEELHTAYLFRGVFFTMSASAGTGLLLSTLFRYRQRIASLFVSIVMLFQILFSSFLFKDNAIDLSPITISNYSIRVIGSGLGFAKSSFKGDVPPGVFGVSLAHARETLLPLAVCFVFCLFTSGITLYLADVRYWDDDLQPK